MGFPILIRSLTTFVLFSGLSFAQSISKCPTQETSYTASDASLWAICPNSDYQAPSGQILNSIKSNTACAQLCQQYQNGGCLKAVYDKTNFICHLKGNGTVPWVSSSYYDSIRFVSRPSQGSTVAACPNNERNVTTSDGAQWAICPLTDYEGNTLQALYQVASETACATSCGKSNGCTRAVYDPKNLACFLKDGTQNRWTFNSAYETIRLVSKAPQQGDPVTSCPSGDRNTTSQSGRGWAICNSTDFGGAASQITNGVTSAFNCMQQCDQTKGCTRAGWDPKNSICFLKDSDAVWAYNGDYQSIRLVNGTSSFTGNRGKWAPAVNLPVVPAGAFVVPE